MLDDDETHPNPELQELARSYHEPPPVPRDAMWTRIQTERQRQPAPERHVVRFPSERVRRYAVPAALAAVLLIGIAIGWGMRGTGQGVVMPRAVATAPAGAPSTGVTPAATPGEVAYRLVATQYLGQSEAFLTLFRASMQRDRLDPLATATARRLLSTNRLLLDSPAAADPRLKSLLQDLELVLAQIAQLSPGTERQDLELITDGIERGTVLVRLRAAVPAGSPATLTQGAL